LKLFRVRSYSDLWRSEEPVYLQIDDGHAEIRGAKVLLDG